MSEHLKQVYLKQGRERSVNRLHPWIFSGAIERTVNNPVEGEIVEVYSSSKEFLAIGHYFTASIAVKILAYSKQALDQAFWNDRIHAAVELRKALGLLDCLSTNAFRLVHGEGDNLPGLIVDVYAETAVLQFHSLGMYNLKQEITLAITNNLSQIKAVYSRSEGGLKESAKAQGITIEDGYLYGENNNNIISENNLKFKIDLQSGQKTGFFIDQRENRALLRKYSCNRNLLNAFSYSGAFTVYGLAGGAKSVVSLDSSEKALELAKTNVELNFPEAKHQIINADCMDYLKDLSSDYDLIVLDPPAFAKRRNALEQALNAYKRINFWALKAIRPHGILFTFSCSQAVSQTDFIEVIRSSAWQAKRTIKILHVLHQGADHPISIHHPEGEYLKGVVLYVE